MPGTTVLDVGIIGRFPLPLPRTSPSGVATFRRLCIADRWDASACESGSKPSTVTSSCSRPVARCEDRNHSDNARVRVSTRNV